MCLDEVATFYIYKKIYMNHEPDDEKSYIKPVAEIHKVEDLKNL